MLSDRNILCISVPQWKGDYAATIIELMKVAGRQNKVLYVQNPYTIKDLVSAITGKKKFPWKKVFGLVSRTHAYQTEAGGQVYVLVPPLTLSINFLSPGRPYNILLRFNGWLVRRAISRHLKKLGMSEQLIGITSFNPMMGIVTGRRFNEQLLIYHCYDEIKEATWMKKHGAEHETEFMKMVDAVIVTSKGLLEKKQGMTKNCFLVKNAADIKLFNTGFNEDVPSIRTVGYIGSLDNRVDYSLLTFLIESMPMVHFLFVGRIIDKEGEAQLRRFKNVSLAGAKKVEELPAYLRTFSVGIIPFVKNEFTRGIYPLKINEYLAAGLPVVSTDFSYLDDFREVISVANDNADFLDKLKNEIESDTISRKLDRQKIASENTWESRVEQLSNIILQLEQNRTTELLN